MQNNDNYVNNSNSQGSTPVQNTGESGVLNNSYIQNVSSDQDLVTQSQSGYKSSDKHSEYISNATQNVSGNQDIQSSESTESTDGARVINETVEESPQTIVQDFHNQNNSNSSSSYYSPPGSGDDKKPNSLAALIGGGVYSTFKFFFDIVQVVVIAFAIFIVFYLFIVSPHTIDGWSMRPNFCDGDLILADKLTPNFNPYKVGDVVVFQKDENNDYIKRIVGAEGDTIKVQGGKVYRNGQLMEEPYLQPSVITTVGSSRGLQEGEEYTVPEGKFMVFGDNRPASTDSRVFLAIDPDGENPIKGRVRFIIWPFNRFGIFDEGTAAPPDFCDL